MSDIRLGNSGKININNLKAGIKKEQIQHDEKLQKLFDAVDTHKDGVLDDNEIEQFKKQILEQAGNDKLSNREANKFLKNLKMEHITKEDLFEFIETLSQEGENITESVCVSDKKGNKTYKITYKDNSTELINDDLSRDVVTKGDNGETIVKHFKKDANKPSTITVKKQDGSTETTKMDEDGKPIEKVVVDKDGNTTTTVIGEKNLPTMQKVIPKSGTPIEIIIMDEKGKPKSKTVENGATIEEYTYDEKGNPVLNTKSENKGIPAKEKITTYTYNEDGTTIATTKEANKQTELITKGGDFISETVTNDKGHRLSQTKNVDGQLYTKSYDGNGNTLGVIVQNGESISALAEKFGCSVDDIIKANKGLVQGKGKDAYFLVGTEIKIPREIDADDKVFEGRTSSEEAIEGYSAYMQTKAAEEAQKAQEAQQAQETQETQEAQEKTQKELQEKQREAKEIAEGMYNACTAKRMGSIGHEDFQTPLKKINEQNASAVISQHNAAHPEESLVALICNEKMSSSGDRKEALTHIMNQLAAEARAKGIPEADIKKYVNEFNISMKAEFKKVGAISPNKMEACMKALHGLVLSADVKADEITDQEAIESFNETAKGEYENAEDQYNTAREKEGWAAKTGDTVLGWFGCITKEDMDGKLAAYKGDIEKLQNCKTEAEFKKAYEEVFGIPFDKKKIAAYETAKAEMQLAMGAKASADSMQQLYNEARGLDYEAYKAKVADAFKGNPSEDGKPTGLTPEDIDEIVDALSVDYMKKHPHADKKDVLRHFVDMQKQKQMEIYNDVTKGRSIEQMDKELDSIRQSAFGTKDIVNDVIQYNQNQEMTGMAVEMAGEIAATAALQAIPGLGQLAAAKLAVSAAKWGTRGAKFLKYAKNASNIMTKASTSLEKGAKGLEKVNKAINSSKASRIATNTGAAFVGTTGVDLSNGKSVKEALQKGMQNAVFAGAGGFSNEFAPILSKTLGLPNKVSKELADEIAEAALDVLTSGGASVAMLGEYTSTDAFMDLATGIIMNRLGKVGVKNAGQKPEQPKTPVTDKASSNGSAQPSSVKVGEAKAEKIVDEVDAVVSNPETSGEELARVRQEVDGLQNRDLRRDAEQKIDNAAENLSPEEKAKYEAAKKANAEKNINHIFEKHSELTSADARVLSEYIQNTDDIEVLNKLRQQLADKEHSYGGITANYDKLRGAIDKKVAELQPTPAKINTEQRENVVNMLKEKATTGKGLNENEFKELTAYISTITSGDDLKEIKNLIGGKKMTSAQKKELKELLATKTDSIKAQSASAETNTAAKTENPNPVETKSTEQAEDLKPINSEITAGSLYDIKNPEEFVNQLKQALPDAELAKTLDGLSAEDADILKRAYNDIFPNGGDEFALNDFNELLQSLQNRSKKNNTKLADELQLIDKILKAPSGKNGEIIDCVLMSRIPTEEKVLDNIERLLKLKETCDNPLLNIDNIIVISGKFKDKDDIEVLVKRFEAKNPDGSYKYNVDEYDEFSVDPTAANRLKQEMLDKYKDKPEIHKGISEFFENADLESIKDFRSFIYDNDEQKFLYNLRHNTPKTIMSDIKIGLDSIDDVDFRKMIDETLAEIENSDMLQITKAKNLREQRQLVDSYNNLTGNYSTIEAGENQIWGSYWKDYLNYIKQNDSALEKLIKSQGNSRGGIAAKFENFVKKRYEDLKDIFITDNKNHREILNSMVKEFEESQRIELFVDYCKNNNDKACNKIYKDVYLNRSDFTPEIKQKLSDISDKFGVKVFLDSKITSDTDKCLKYIEQELAEWKKASNGSAKMPPVLDFTGAKKDYYDNTSAYGQGKTAGFSESGSSDAISMYGCTLEQLEWTFRHEMTHSNDLKLLNSFPEGFLSKAGDTTIAQKSKFFEELVEIGVDPSHAPYAYNNPQEFIAVASEGDLSKCSPELKQTLLDFGMPEWQFNMKSKADLVQEVVDLKANKIADDAKDFKLCTSVQEAEKLYDKLISKRWIGEADLKDGEPIYWSPNGWAQAMYKNDHPQGTPWKMHMYANSPEEWANVAQLAMPYLHKNEVVYKTVTDLDDHFNVLREPIEGQSISTQTGKAFTIYFESEEQFLQVAKDLEKIFDASGLKSSGKTYGEAQIGESGFLSYRHEYAERGTQYKPDNIDDPYLNSKNTNNLDSKDVEFGTGVARPQYKVGVDYEQPAPTLKQYTDDELLSQFDNKELNSNDFYKIKEDIYNDIRLSGKYSAEESLNCKFEDIEDFNSPYGKVYYTDGWLVHSFDNGCKNLAVDRVSLSVKADPKMLEELDRLLAKGEYQDATGKTHKLSDEAFTKGSYKTDTSAEEWMTRHDPITMYFDETVSKEMLDAIAVVTDKYKRIPSKELSGAVEGCPWIANEPYVTPEQVYDLITRANNINKELGDMINKEAGSYLDLSSGDYLACKKVVDDYEKYLEIKSKIDNEKITNPQPIEDIPAPELENSNIRAVKNDAPDNSIEIAKQRATRELEQEKAEQVALQKEQEYIDKTYNSKKSASESADVFKADFAQKEAAAKALNQVKLEKAEQAAVEREQAYIDRTYGTIHKSASESADVFNAKFADEIAQELEIEISNIDFKNYSSNIDKIKEKIESIPNATLKAKYQQRLNDKIVGFEDNLARQKVIKQKLDEFRTAFAEDNANYSKARADGSYYKAKPEGFSYWAKSDAIMKELDSILGHNKKSRATFNAVELFDTVKYGLDENAVIYPFLASKTLSSIEPYEWKDICKTINFAKKIESNKYINPNETVLVLRNLDNSVYTKEIKDEIKNIYGLDIDSYRQNLVDMMDSEYSRTFKIDVPEGDKDNLIKNILSNNKTNNSIEIKDIQENLVKSIPILKDSANVETIAKELKSLEADTDFAKLDDLHKTIAKWNIITQNMQSNEITSILREYNVPSLVQDRVIYTHLANRLEPLAAAMLHQGDIEMIGVINKIKKGIDSSYKEIDMDTLRSNIDKINDVNNQNFVFSNVPAKNKIPTVKIENHGRNYEVKMLDLNDPEILANLENYGFPAGTTIDDLEFVVHMFGRGREENDLTRLYNALDSKNTVVLSTSLTDGKNRLYDHANIGMIVDYDQNSILTAFNEDLVSGRDKSYYGSQWVHKTTDGSYSRVGGQELTFLKNELMNKLGLNDTEYLELTNYLRDKRQLTQIGDVKIGDKQLSAQELQTALKETQKTLYSGYEGYNEIELFNPTPKAICLTGIELDKVPSYIFEYSQKHDIPIIILNDGKTKPVGLSKSNSLNSADVPHSSVDSNQATHPKRREDNSHARISQQNSTTSQVISNKTWVDAGVDSNGTNIKLSRNSVGSVIIDRDGRKSLVRFPENTNKISLGKDATGADIILTKQADGSIVLTKQNATKPTPNEQPYTGNDIKLQVMQNGTVIVSKGDRASRIKFPEGVNRVSIGKDATGADLMLVKDNNGELKIMKQNSPASSENPNRLDARVNPYPRKTSADTPVNQKTVQQTTPQPTTAKNTSSRYVDKPIQNKHLAELAMRKYPNPSDSVKERLLDIDNALANVDDPYLLEQISKMSDINEIEQITDIMSELNGQSTAFQRVRKDGRDEYYQGSNVADFARTVKSEDAKGFNDLINGKEVSSLNGNDNVKNLDIDLAEEKRLYSLKEYMKDYGRNDLANYLYSKYYLDGLDISPQAKAKMDNIAKTYGTRIFISPSDTKDVDKILAKLENEFEIFDKASNYRWNKPPVVDFNRIKQSYFKKTQGSALSEKRTGSIGFSYMDERELEASLRHELMHSNDWRNARKSEISQEEFNAVFTGDLKVDPETGDVVIDLDKCKYANELRNAGLEDWVIEYGHTSPSELVAVAAEGDMSKYSLEFQNVLKKFGMPEWAFNLPPQVKYYDINSQGSPVKISDDKVAASPFRRLREMFGGSKPKSSINDIFGVPDAIGKRPNFIKGFSNDMGISTSTPVVSTKLKNALELEASGKTLVTQLDANVNPSSISRYVKDGEVCAIGDKLYISDDGVPVELKMTKEKFEELFPPVGCATTEQLGVNTCWLVSRINSMMDSAGGRVRLFSMLEQDGDDILVRLKNRELPIRFTNSKPIYGYPELCLGDNAAPGLDMIFQSVLSERKSMDFGAIAQADVTNALDFDFIEMYKYTGIMQATSLSSHILGTFGQGAYDKNQIKDFIENFVSGKDILNITYGLHHKHIVNYDSETKMVTMHDPNNGGVDRTCLLSDLLAQHDLHAEYWKRRPFNKTSPKVANQPTQTPVSTQANSATTPQRRRVTIGDGKPRVEEIAKPVETNPAKSETTQEQVAKPTPARRRVIIGDGKPRIEEIAKPVETNPAKSETTQEQASSAPTPARLRVTIGDGKPRVEEIAKSVETNPAKSETAHEQVAKPAVRSRLVFNQEMQIGTINGRLIKAEYKGLSSDYVATVVVNGRNFEIKAGTKLKIADGLEISCNKFGIVEFLNYQQAPSAPQSKPVSSQDTKTNTSPTPQPKTAVDLPRGFEHNGTMSYRGVECPKARNANGLEILYYNGKWVRLL